MKKKFLFLTILTLGMVAISGCTDSTNKEIPAASTQESVVKEALTATVIIQKDGEKLQQKEVSFEENTVLYDIMAANFTIEDNDGFITSIDGVAQDDAAGKYWLYDINGEMALEGAKELKIEVGDEVLFKLEEMK